MPEPLKNLFNPEMIALMGKHLKQAYSDFDQQQFLNIATDGLDALELKQRAAQILQALEATLPSDFRKACTVMLISLDPATNLDTSQVSTMSRSGIRGWAIMPMADYVAAHGLDDFDFSLNVLKEFTKRSSSEFAIRDFFLADAKRTLLYALNWADDADQHVRRLASEGSRPRLPWAKGLPVFVKDPTPLIPLLNKLKDDPEEYVRRSVANNLNDIAKDHADIVATLAGEWLKNAGENRKRLVKHACRTLIKQGHKPTLQAFGYSTPRLEIHSFEIKNPHLELGGYLEFEMSLKSKSDKPQPLIIDFIVHHLKANGKTAPKVFKWKVVDLPPGKIITLVKKHPIKPITTRIYYAGHHRLEIQINGETFGKIGFDLTL